MPSPPGADVVLGDHYARVRERLCALLEEEGEAAGAVPVPACPGWTVHGVVAHLVGNIEDGAAGRIQGLPTTELTAEQVARHRDDSLADLVSTWRRLSPVMEAVLDERGLWPGMLDAVTHEHDVRAALDRPRGRDEDTVWAGATRLAASIEAPGAVVITFPDGQEVASSSDGEVFGLRTTPYELVRFRLGRRSRDQVAGLDWARDPEPILDHLFIFGPSPHPQHERG